MSEHFVIGAAKRIITPRLGVPMVGYPIERIAKMVNDDLTVNVMAFGNGKVTSVLISADMIMVSNELTETLKTIISEKNNISKNSIIICAIHTHSAMATAKVWGDKIDDDYMNNVFIPMISEAVTEAVKNAVPALMGVGVTESKVGINRRQITKDGEIILGQNPYGPYDPDMTVISFVTLDKKPIVNLIHYGAHATAAGEGPEITRDWPGYMVDRLEKETATLSIFINGAEGDVGPRISNGKTTGGKQGDISYAAEVGMVAGMDAVRAYTKIKEYREVCFREIFGEIKLPYKPIPSLEELNKARDALGNPGELIEVDALKYKTLTQAIKKVEKGEKFEENLVMTQVLFAFNSLVLVPFAFEIFSQITLRLKEYSVFENTVCISNANGSYGYLPSENELCRGGYEVEMFLYASEQSLKNNTDTIIINEYLKMMQNL